MFPLEARTVLFSMGLVAGVMGIRMVSVAWRRVNHPGFLNWTLSFLLISLCLIGMSCLNLLPFILTGILPLFGVVAALVLIHNGLCAFTEVSPDHRFDMALLGIAAGGICFFAYWHDLPGGRSLVFSACCGIMTLRCARQSWRPARRYLEGRIPILPLLFLGLCALSLVRAAVIPFHPELYYEHGFMRGGLQMLTIIAAVLLLVGIETELMLMSFRRLEQSLIDSEGKYRRLIENVQKDYYIYSLDRQGCFTYASPSMRDICNDDPRTLLGRNWRDLFVMKDEVLERIERVDAFCLEGRVPDPVQIEFEHPEYGTVCIETQKQPVFDRHGAVVGIEGIGRNVTRQRRVEEELLRMATTDSLTGALNRGEFMRRAHAEMVRCHRDGVPFAVLLLDADHFKLVNDTYGHDVGDQVLCALAQACMAHLRPYDLFCRFGGEEFAALLPKARSAEAQDIAQRLLQAVRGICLRVGNATVGCTVSIGIAESLSDEIGLQGIIKRADVALYQAKHDGRDRCARSQELPAASA